MAARSSVLAALSPAAFGNFGCEEPSEEKFLSVVISGRQAFGVQEDDLGVKHSCTVNSGRRRLGPKEVWKLECDRPFEIECPQGSESLEDVSETSHHRLSFKSFRNEHFRLRKPFPVLAREAVPKWRDCSSSALESKLRTMYSKMELSRPTASTLRKKSDSLRGDIKEVWSHKRVQANKLFDRRALQFEGPYEGADTCCREEMRSSWRTPNGMSPPSRWRAPSDDHSANVAREVEVRRAVGRAEVEKLALRHRAKTLAFQQTWAEKFGRGAASTSRFEAAFRRRKQVGAEKLEVIHRELSGSKDKEKEKDKDAALGMKSR